MRNQLDMENLIEIEDQLKKGALTVTQVRNTMGYKNRLSLLFFERMLNKYEKMESNLNILIAGIETLWEKGEKKKIIQYIEQYTAPLPDEWREKIMNQWKSKI